MKRYTSAPASGSTLPITTRAARLTPAQVELKKKILAAIKKEIGDSNPGPLRPKDMVQAFFIGTAIKALENKSDAEIEQYIKDQKDDRKLPWS